MRFLFFALIALTGFARSVAGQAPADQHASLPAPDPGAADAVYEAVVRYQIAAWQLGADSYCIKIKGTDADEKLLHSLKPLPVKPASDCVEQRKKFDMFVIDKHSKKKSVLFGAGNIRWTSETTAEVEGSYLCGSQCMAGGVYHVAKDEGQWKVTKFDVYIRE
jgi:hypothetical protein